MSGLNTPEEIIRDKTAVEAGYVKHPKDPGKATNHGITEVTAGEHKHLWAKHGWDGNMQTMPVSLAYEIYRVSWWNKMHLDEFAKYSWPLAERMFDFGINAGRGNAGKSIQAILNVHNKSQSLYADLVMDGAIGPNTVRALNAFMQANRNDAHAAEKLTMLMFAAQNWHYIQISLNREDNEAFTNGWTNRTYRDWYAYAKWLTP